MITALDAPTSSGASLAQILLSAIGAAVLTSALALVLRIWEFRREDASRFTTDKRLYYVKVMTLAQESWDLQREHERNRAMLVALKESWQEEFRQGGTEGPASPTLQGQAEALEFAVDELGMRLGPHLRELHEALNVVLLVAPKRVRVCLPDLLSAVRYGGREEFDAALLALQSAARSDLDVGDG